MSKNLKLCPICGKKFLVGRHEKACTKNLPTLWFLYKQALLGISRGRRGRTELQEILQ